VKGVLKIFMKERTLRIEADLLSHESRRLIKHRGTCSQKLDEKNSTLIEIPKFYNSCEG